VSIAVRPARLADAASLSALHSGAFDDGWSEADFTMWLARMEAFAILALREREAVAFGLALAAGDDAELLTIAATASHRRNGLGREIFRALDAEAKDRSLRRWVLEVARNNLPALGLYKSEGFVEIGVRNAYYRQREGWADALVLSRPVGHVSGHTGA
jgi:[ribosomal protein S18]-alanine N-acetyltransferase